jgi:hypothetical protein
MARIPIIDRADMNAEQARVYDEAKSTSGIVGGPYYAYIRLPKLLTACQNLRGCLAAGPLSPREQQIVNLTVARHWNVAGELTDFGGRAHAFRASSGLTNSGRSAPVRAREWVMSSCAV